MKNMIDRLLGKRARTTKNISTEIATQEAEIAASRAKMEASKAARAAAMDAFDDEAHKAADNALASAGRDIERREKAIVGLNKAHAEAAEAEARDAFRRDDAALKAECDELAERVALEYPALAGGLTDLLAELQSKAADRRAMAARAKVLGEPMTAEDPEACRGVTTKRWSVTFRNSNGEGTIKAPIEDAPRGSIKWDEDEPYSVRSEVKIVQATGGTRPRSLAETVGDLPGFRAEDKPIRRQPTQEGEVIPLVDALFLRRRVS